jgi:predicted metalloprotease with PDZ domain
MAEGWVSYYTELMRTRMGHRDEAEGWAKLAEGFARGERGGRGLSLQATSDNMRQTFAYQRVYWGGAAIAFFTDIALREDSGGEVSLDDAMSELRRCCGDASRRWAAADLLAHLDQWYGKPLFSRVAAENLSRITFPPVAEGFGRLGIEIGRDGSARLDDAHAATSTRRAMMGPR